MDEKVRGRKFNIIRYVRIMYIVYYMFGIVYRVYFTRLFYFHHTFFPTILKKKNVKNIFFKILRTSKKSDHHKDLRNLRSIFGLVYIYIYMGIQDFQYKCGTP